MAKKNFGAGKKGFLNNKITKSTALNASLKATGKQDVFSKITIHPELEKYIAPLAPEEFALLENNILKVKKVRDPLLLWKYSEEEYFILDGHHRFTVLGNHREENIDWTYQFVTLEGLPEAFELMEEIQLGRRNATRNYISYLRGRAYQNEKQNHGGDRKSGEAVSEKTVTRVARRFNVSERTISLDATFAKAIDALNDPKHGVDFTELRNSILLNTTSLKKQEIVFMGHVPNLSIPHYLDYLENGGTLDALSEIPFSELNDFLVNGKSEPKKEPVKAKKPSVKKDRFVSWYEQEQKSISKLIKKGSEEEKQQKKQELLDRITQLQGLVEGIQ